MALKSHNNKIFTIFFQAISLLLKLLAKNNLCNIYMKIKTKRLDSGNNIDVKIFQIKLHRNIELRLILIFFCIVFTYFSVLFNFLLTLRKLVLKIKYLYNILISFSFNRKTI